MDMYKYFFFYFKEIIENLLAQIKAIVLVSCVFLSPLIFSIQYASDIVDFSSNFDQTIINSLTNSHFSSTESMTSRQIVYV